MRRISSWQVAGFFLLLWAQALPAQITELIDPLVGTDAHGHTFPGATTPFGMVQLSPDTRVEGWDACSGYHYSDSSIIGFSHTHLSGTGAIDLGDILFMPLTGTLQLRPGEAEFPDGGYRSRFSHNDEVAEPGSYRVLLLDDSIQVELTATARTGWHRYTWPQSDSGWVLIDLLHGLGPDRVTDSRVSIDSPYQLSGYRRSSGWAADQHVYFVAQFSEPMTEWGLASNGSLELDATHRRGGDLQAALRFDVDVDVPLVVKVGISAVDSLGALRNLDVEGGGWDFDGVRMAARDAWQEAAGKIAISGGTLEQRRTFYTAMYHAQIAPTLFMDVDGRYRGADKGIHQSDQFANYSTLSLWDTFRAAHPLFSLIAPRKQRDFIHSLLARYDELGSLPIWELLGNETGTMIGYHAISVIVDAWSKGIRDFDVKQALTAMDSTMRQNANELATYRDLGFIPYDKAGDSVSRTLEYAYNDWCLSVFAGALGQDALRDQALQRARNYLNVFDPNSRFMRARAADGRWQPDFQPTKFYPLGPGPFTEASAWQYSFFVPHDLETLISLFPGREAFIAKLDSLFDEDLATATEERVVDATGVIGNYVHGNEPSHHIAYLYNYAGAPWKSQQAVRRIMDNQYSDSPEGLCGNEDCGQLSAWYVFSAMGFYPVCPGNDIYAFGSPLFDKAELQLENGRTFTMEAVGQSARNMYIQRIEKDGVPYEKAWFTHQNVRAGAHFRLFMGPEPNKAWASDPQVAPPSRMMRADVEIKYPTRVFPPYFDSETRIFADSLKLSMLCETPGATLHYRINGGSEKLYSAPITLAQTSRIQARAAKDNLRDSPVVMTTFYRGLSRNDDSDYPAILWQTPSHPKYHGGGKFGLLDGLRAGAQLADPRWAGFEGVDFEIIFDLGKPVPITQVSAGFLQDTGSWIFFPKSVEIAISNNSAVYYKAGREQVPIATAPSAAARREIAVQLSGEPVRFVRVTAEGVKTCPDWHRGAGGRAWIFMDEIVLGY